MPLGEVIAPKKPKVSLYHEVSFPFQNIKVSDRIQKCPDCGEVITDKLLTSKDFFRCSNCGTSSRFLTLPVYRTAKIRITNDSEEITLYSAQLSDYCRTHGIDVTNEDQITQNMLKD